MPPSNFDSTTIYAATTTPGPARRRKKASTQTSASTSICGSETPLTAIRSRRRKNPTSSGVGKSSSSSHRKQEDDFIANFASSDLKYSFCGRDSDGDVGSSRRCGSDGNKAVSERRNLKKKSTKINCGINGAAKCGDSDHSSGCSSSANGKEANGSESKCQINKENLVNHTSRDFRHDTKGRINTSDKPSIRSESRKGSTNPISTSSRRMDKSYSPEVNDEDGDTLSEQMAKFNINGTGSSNSKIAAKKKPTSTRHEDVDNLCNDFDSFGCKDSVKPLTSIEPVRRKNYHFPPLGCGSEHISVDTSGECHGSLQCAKSALQEAIEIANASECSESICKVFTTSTSLVDAVATASFSCYEHSASVLLEENGPKLIDTSKKCLKLLSSSSNSSSPSVSLEEHRSKDAKKKCPLELALLKVAIYCLRAALPYLENSFISNTFHTSACQAAVKLFYHCVVTAGDACHHRFQSFAASLTSSSKCQSTKTYEYSLILEYGLLCLASYDGLGRLLRSFSWPGFQCDYLRMGGKRSKKSSRKISWENMFPVPFLGDKGEVNSEPRTKKTALELPSRQIKKIILESAICATSSSLHMSVLSLYAGSTNSVHWKVPNEFDFSSDVIPEVCSGKFEDEPMFRRLLTTVVQTCVVDSLLTIDNGVGDSSSFNADATRHVKKVFRVVWDGARCAENICNILDGPALRIGCLHLQSEAITFLLACLEATFNKFVREIRDITNAEMVELMALLDRASSSSMKCTAGFEKVLNQLQHTTTSMRGELIHFHDCIGMQLDHVVELYLRISRKRSFLPSSYFDYCTYKYIQKWRLISSVDNIDATFSLAVDTDLEPRKDNIESLVGMATFSVAYVCLHSIHGISQSGVVTRVSIDLIEKIVVNFEHVVIRKCPSTSRSRCRSILGMLDLPRIASKALNSLQLENQGYNGKESYFAAVGSIMGRCFAPLDLTLAKETSDQNQVFNLRLSGADNYSKSAALVLFSLNNRGALSEGRVIQSSEEACLLLKKAYNVLIPMIHASDHPSSLATSAEVFAKSSAYISKILAENKENVLSLQQQVYTTEVLFAIASKGIDRRLFEKYQLPNRFVKLASAFEMKGDFVASCSSLALAARSTIERDLEQLELIAANETFPSDELLFPGNRIVDPAIFKDEFLETSGLSTIISRLIRAFIEHLKLRQASPIESIRGPLSFLNNTVMSEVLGTIQCINGDFGKRISVLALARYILSTFQDDPLSAQLTIKLVQEILRCSTKVAKGAFKGDDSDEAALQVFLQDQVDFLTAQIKQLSEVLESSSKQQVASSLHVTYAAYLMDSRFLLFCSQSSWASFQHGLDYLSQVLLQHSCKQLWSANELFEDANEDGESTTGNVIFYAQWAAIQLQYAIIYEHFALVMPTQELDISDPESKSPAEFPSESYDSVVEQYKLALSICSHAVGQWNSSGIEISPDVFQSLVTSIKRLLCRFNRYRDPISSTHCFVLLQQFYAAMDEPSSVIESLADLVLISTNFETLSDVFIQKSSTFDFNEKEEMIEEGIRNIIDKQSFPHFKGLTPEVLLSSIKQIITPREDRRSALILENVTSENALNADTSYIKEEECFEDEFNAMSDCTLVASLVQLQSLFSSALMVRAQDLVDLNKPSAAVRLLRHCRGEFRKLMKLLRFASRRIKNVLLDDLALHTDDMVAVTFERMAVAFNSLGIRRKAEDCAIAAALKNKLFVYEQSMVSRISLKTMMDLIGKYKHVEGFMPLIRSLVKIKASSLSPDKIESDVILQNGSLYTFTDDKIQCTNEIVSNAKTCLTYASAFQHVRSLENVIKSQITQTHCLVTKLNDLIEDESIAGVPLTSFTRAVETEICMKFTDGCKTESLLAPSSYSAEFYYEMGLKVLNDHKSRLELYSLWKKHSVYANDVEADDTTISSMQNIIQARKLFRCAWKIAPPSSANLTKQILRCLALVLGPEHSETASLLHSSVGGAARNVFLDRLSEKGNGKMQVKQFFDAFEKSDSDDMKAAMENMFSDAVDVIPNTWVVSVVVICPTGELMISSIQSNGSHKRFQNITTICVFPGGAKNSPRADVHTDLLIPLDSIIERSRKQLSGMSQEAQQLEYTEESARRKWWQERHRIDKNLESLVQLAEKKYFGHRQVCARLIPVGDVECCPGDFSSSDDSSSECSDFARGNLESRFDAAEHDCLHPPKVGDTFDDEVERENVKKLTVPVIKERLKEIGYEGKLSKLRKAELIDLLVSIMKDRFSSDSAHRDQDEVIQRGPDHHSMTPSSVGSDSTTCCDHHCTVLILDEHLQRFPFESMPMFDKKAVTRVPSLPFLLASLNELKSRGLSHELPGVHPHKVKCVIDPECNLTETALNIAPALDAIAKKNNCTWESVIGAKPSLDFMTTSIAEQDGLLLYCGHGGGEMVIARKNIEDMMVVSSNHDSLQFQRGCKSAVVLMGCSSGKLQSVNTPRENPSGNFYEILYEPEGIALSYILAGAPCVVGNLWDVTDRDIDRYCLTLMKNFFGDCEDAGSSKQSPSLAKCVADARSACKLRYIVGSAPVCYGIPVVRYW